MTTAEIVTFVLIDIVIIVVLARFVGSLMKYIGQPIVLGEILAGIILGPTVIGPTLAGDLFPTEARPALAAIATVAIAFFMFLVGLGLDMSLLKGRVMQSSVVTVSAVAIPFVAGYFVAPLLYKPEFFLGALPNEGAFSLFIGAAMTVTAFPVMARILIERRLTRTPMGAVGLASAAAVTVALFLLVGVAAGAAEGAGPGSSLATLGWTALFLVGMFGPVRYGLAWLGRYYDRVGRLTPNLIAAVFVMIVATAWMTTKIGITEVIGPFVLGLCLPRREGMAADLQEKIDSFAVLFLLPIFFGFSGLATNLRTLGTSLILGVVVFIVVGVATKWIPTAIAGRAVGLTWREGNLLGVLMSCRGLLPLLVASVGASVGVIEAGGPVYAILIVYAIVTTVMTNPGANLFLPKEAPPPPDVDVAEAPAETKRVMVAVGPGGSAARLAGAAKALAGQHRPLELVVVQPAELPEGSSIFSGVEQAERDVALSLSGLVPLAAVVGGQGVTVTPVAYQSPDVVDDFLRVADELRPSLLVTGVRRRFAAEDSKRADAIAAGAGVRTAVFYDPSGEGVYPDMGAPVVAGPGMRDVASDLAAGLGVKLADNGVTGGASALVLPMTAGWADLLPPAQSPVFVVSEPSRRGEDEHPAAAVATP